MAAVIALLAGMAGLSMLIVGQVLSRRAVRTSGRGATLRAEVMDALDRDGMAASVKIYRERTGAGLTEAHDAVLRIARDGY